MRKLFDLTYSTSWVLSRVRRRVQVCTSNGYSLMQSNTNYEYILSSMFNNQSRFYYVMQVLLNVKHIRDKNYLAIIENNIIQIKK